jgi:hypothetical protein
MSDLKEDLDHALHTVTFSEAPVEAAKRGGRRIRARRRLSVVAGALAVAAVAAGYPALTRTAAAPPPTPASGQKAHAPHQKPYHGDQVITAWGGGATTQAPNGLASKTGEMAAGTVGDMKWQMSVIAPGPKNPVPADPCYTITVILAGSSMQGTCYDLPASTFPRNGDPGAFTGMSDGVNAVTVGEATQDVAYFIVTFTDGQRLKLIPVSVHGHRYVAWIAPLSMTVKSAEAYLGSAYATSGQVATAIPFTQRGRAPVFLEWQEPGQAAPPRATRVIAASPAGAHAWQATAATGPWGTCVGVNGDYQCLELPATGPVVTAGPLTWSRQGVRLIVGTVPAGVAKVTVTLSSGQPATVGTVVAGHEKLFAFAVGKGVTATGWTSYDASGKRTSIGTMA